MKDLDEDEIRALLDNIREIEAMQDHYLASARAKLREALNDESPAEAGPATPRNEAARQDSKRGGA